MINKEVESSQLGPTSKIPFAPADEEKSHQTIMQIAYTPTEEIRAKSDLMIVPSLPPTDEAKSVHSIMPSEDESDYSLHSSKCFTEELIGMLNSPAMGSSFHEEEKKEAW